MTTAKPYELLARFKPDGTIAGVSVRTITTVNGRDYESDPTPLSGATDPSFTAFASAFSAAVVAERDALLAEKATWQSQIDTLTAEKAALQAQLDALQESTVVVTAVKGRVALKRAGLLETVEQKTLQPGQWFRNKADHSDCVEFMVMSGHETPVPLVADIHGYSHAIPDLCERYEACDPPQPQKTRVRLWKNNYGSVMSNDDCERLGWQEIHHDSEGFYVENQP